MPMREFSRDIWDYLTEIPYMPSRQDRDEVVRRANENPRHAKRIHIWDYFFRLNPNDVGKPQMREMARLTQQREIELAENTARAFGMLRLALIPVLAGLGMTFFLAAQKDQTLGFLGPVVSALGVALLIVIGVLYWRTRHRIQILYQEMIDELQKSVKALRSKIPDPPDDEQVHRWLQEDLDWLAQYAIKQTGIDTSAVKPDKADNPLCILGPAQLQHRDLVPRPFLDKEEVDLLKHVKAARFAFLPGDRFEDFYGVYSVEFIVLGKDRLGNYGCFFDFITGKIYGEHTAEMYYKDVVELSVREEYRQVNMSWLHKQTVKAPTFSMSLASGNTIEISFASAEYVSLLKMQLPEGTNRIDPTHWVRNPEIATQKAIEALRAELQKHKP